MKKIAIFLLLMLAFNGLHAQKAASSQDSIRVFYDRLFLVMKRGYLYKDKVDWAEIEPKVRTNLRRYPNFKSSLQEVATIFDFAKADHCSVFYKGTRFAGNFGGPTGKDFSGQWLKKYASKPEFEVKVLDDRFGYILMPGINLVDMDKEAAHKIA